MWHEVDWEAVAREDNAWAPPCSPAAVEELVVVTRLHLYNQDLPCGAAALRRYLHEQECLRPLPSTRRIRQILTLYGLSHGRTGWYDEETVEDLPVDVPRSAWVRPAQRRHFEWRRGIYQE